eukprot:5845943-Prymnesium_polylepis.1
MQTQPQQRWQIRCAWLSSGLEPQIVIFLRNRDATTLTKAQDRIDQLKQTVQASATQQDASKSVLSEQAAGIKQLSRELEDLRRGAIEQREVEESLKQEIEGLEAAAEEAEAEIRHMTEERDSLDGGGEETRGRKAGHRGHSALAEQWSSLGKEAKRKALCAATEMTSNLSSPVREPTIGNLLLSPGCLRPEA